MKKIYLVGLLVLGLAVAGCSSYSANKSLPHSTPTQTQTKSSLPTNCQNEAILKVLGKGSQAWDKTDPAKVSAALDCLYGFPSTDLAVTVRYSSSSAAQWEAIFKKESEQGSGDWISDTLTSSKYSTLYRETYAQDDFSDDSVDYKVYKDGVMMLYSSPGHYDRNDQILLAGLGAIK